MSTPFAIVRGLQGAIDGEAWCDQDAPTLSDSPFGEAGWRNREKPTRGASQTQLTCQASPDLIFSNATPSRRR